MGLERFLSKASTTFGMSRPMRTIRFKQPRCAIVTGVAFLVVFCFFTIHMDEEGGIRFGLFRKSQGSRLGCNMDMVLPFDERYPETKSHFKKEPEVTCQKTSDNVLSTMVGGQLKFESSVAKKYYPTLTNCYYKPLTYNKEDFNSVLYGLQVSVEMDKTVSVPDELIMVECEDKDKKIVFRHLHKQIIPKDKNIHGVPFKQREPGDMNILGIILESTGKLATLRHGEEFHKYITEELGGVLLEKHTKTGLNTNPNLYSLISGRNIYKDWKTLLVNKISDIPTIVQEFVKAGYVTLMSEEVAKVPQFLRYFLSPPTDHWNRPTLNIVADYGVKPIDYLNRTEDELEFCYGTENKVRMTLDWITEFTEKYKDHKWAALTYINRPLGTHKNLNGISRNIPIFDEFFKKLQKSGVLDNTIVMFGGDHGNGFVEDYFQTQIGSYEARLPLGYAIFPKWFQQKHKKAYENLKFNGKNRLTSHYDTYKTFLAILSGEYKNPPDVAAVDEAHPGVSLFQPLPEWRGCRETGVPAHYCLCESFTPLPHDDPRIIKASKAIVDTLNYKLHNSGDLCVTYTEFKVNISKITSTGDGFSIILQMVPYPANFRAYVKKEGTTYTAQDIERLDNYRDLAACLNKLGEKDTFKLDSHLASYCVCSDLKLNNRKSILKEGEQ